MSQAQFTAGSGIVTRNLRPWRLRLQVGAIYRSRLVRLALLATLVVAVLRTTLLDWRRVTGPSMSPTLASGQLLICNRLAYGCRLPGMRSYLVEWSTPVPGELVIYSSPTDGECCVKRVAVHEGRGASSSGEVWVLGDNLEQSCDSRDHGAVPLSLIHGRAHVFSLGFARLREETPGAE